MMRRSGDIYSGDFIIKANTKRQAGKKLNSLTVLTKPRRKADINGSFTLPEVGPTPDFSPGVDTSRQKENTAEKTDNRERYKYEAKICCSLLNVCVFSTRLILSRRLMIYTV